MPYFAGRTFDSFDDFHNELKSYNHMCPEHGCAYVVVFFFFFLFLSFFLIWVEVAEKNVTPRLWAKERSHLDL